MQQRLNFRGRRGRTCIDNQDAVFTGLHRDIAARSDDHIHVGTDGQRAHCAIGCVGVIDALLWIEDDGPRLMGAKNCRRKREKQAEESDHFHFPWPATTFLRYSGYMVSGPPRVDSKGIPCSLANSSR